MKYLFLLVSFVFFTIAQAQESFLKKDLLINAGASLIRYGHPSYPHSEAALKSLPLSMSIEYAIHHHWSVGIFGGYYSRQYRYSDSLPNEAKGSRVYKSRYVPFGIKGTFHFAPLIEKKYKTDIGSDKLDVYASGMLGYRYNFLNHARGTGAESKSRPVAGAVIGVRYYWSYCFALYGEVGPSIFGIIGVGLTLRL